MNKTTDICSAKILKGAVNMLSGFLQSFGETFCKFKTVFLQNTHTWSVKILRSIQQKYWETFYKKSKGVLQKC